MHSLQEHVGVLVALIGLLASGLVGCVVYIWKGSNATAQKIAATQAACMASLPERFVPMSVYRDDIKLIFQRQADLRERLPRDFLMRSEAETFLGAVKELKGAVEGLRQGFEERMDRMFHIVLTGRGHDNG